MTTPLFERLAAGDRALYARWAIPPTAERGTRFGWKAITHLGGGVSTVSATLALLAAPVAPRGSGLRALAALVLSHLLVQALKRCCTRPRPSAHGAAPLLREPDRYSFPSGHATAALTVALAYAAAFPALGFPLLCLGLVVGWSRVAIGVHFPGDVMAGLVIAAVTTRLVALLT